MFSGYAEVVTGCSWAAMICVGVQVLTKRLLLDVRRYHYFRDLLLIGAWLLLAIWFVVTFVVSYYARELSFNFFGWPFSFWMGAQGSLVIYCVIIWYYARHMGKLDIEHGVQESED